MCKHFNSIPWPATVMGPLIGALPSLLAVDDRAYRAARERPTGGKGCITLVSIAQRRALIITSPCAALTQDMFLHSVIFID